MRQHSSGIWTTFGQDEITRLQCITHIVLETCLHEGEGSVLAGLYCGTLYVTLCSAQGSGVRNIFHPLLYQKSLDLMKVQDEKHVFKGIKEYTKALKKLLISQLKIPEQAYWQTIKCLLCCMNNVCHEKIFASCLPEILAAAVKTPRHLGILINESLPYLASGKSFLSVTTRDIIVDYYNRNSSTEVCLSYFTNLIHHLCFKISERTEVRKQTEAHILILVSELTSDQFKYYVAWLVEEFIQSIKIVHRIFAIEMCFQAIFNKNCTDELSNLIVSAILENLRDKAPTVRAKCLTIVSDLLSKGERNVSDYVSKYFKHGTDDSVCESVEMLVSDDKSSVRKAAAVLLLQLLEKIKLRSRWLKLLYRLSIDSAVSVKKTALININKLLENHRNNPIIQRLWLETVLPSINDNENSIKELCVEQLRGFVEDHIQEEHTWAILTLIADPRSLDLQEYFDFGIKQLKQNGFSLSSSSQKMVKDKSEENKAAAMLLMSKLIGSFSAIDPEYFLECLKDSIVLTTDASYQECILSMRCLKSLKNITEDLQSEIITFLQNEISQCKQPLPVIKEMVLTVARLSTQQDKESFSEFCNTTMQSCITFLATLTLSDRLYNPVSSNFASKHIFTLGELSQYCYKEFELNMVVSLKELIINNEKNPFPTTVRAQAVLSLGKICLIHENIAKESVTVISAVLEADQSEAVRNNILIVLSDLIVRYPTLVEEYLYCVTDCLHDPCLTLRRQAIVILTRLLQEDYLKWRSGIVMKYLSNLVDDNEDIRKLCKMCLTNILLVRYPKTYYDYFVEFIFFANGLFSFISAHEPNLEKFAFAGPENGDNRKTIYSIMLKPLTDQQKLEMTGRIGKEVLSLFIKENEVSLKADMTPLLKDALWILCCPEIKLSSLKTRTDDFDEDDENAAALNARTKIVSEIVKKNVIENLIPIVLPLREKLKKLKSPLQHDLSLFMSKIMTDFKAEMEDILGQDKQLVCEIQHDMELLEKELVENDLDTIVPTTLLNMTPGFLKNFNTPSNTPLTNGPGQFFSSPFFQVPTPLNKFLTPGGNRRSGLSMAKRLSHHMTPTAYANTTPTNRNTRPEIPPFPHMIGAEPTHTETGTDASVIGDIEMESDALDHAEPVVASSHASEKKAEVVLAKTQKKGKPVPLVRHLFNPDKSVELSKCDTPIGIPASNSRPASQLLLSKRNRDGAMKAAGSRQFAPPKKVTEDVELVVEEVATDNNVPEQADGKTDVDKEETSINTELSHLSVQKDSSPAVMDEVNKTAPIQDVPATEEPIQSTKDPKGEKKEIPPTQVLSLFGQKMAEKKKKMAAQAKAKRKCIDSVNNKTVAKQQQPPAIQPVSQPDNPITLPTTILEGLPETILPQTDLKQPEPKDTRKVAPEEVTVQTVAKVQPKATTSNNAASSGNTVLPDETQSHPAVINAASAAQPERIDKLSTNSKPVPDVHVAKDATISKPPKKLSLFEQKLAERKAKMKMQSKEKRLDSISELPGPSAKPVVRNIDRNSRVLLTNQVIRKKKLSNDQYQIVEEESIGRVADPGADFTEMIVEPKPSSSGLPLDLEQPSSVALPVEEPSSCVTSTPVVKAGPRVTSTPYETTAKTRRNVFSSELSPIKEPTS